MNPFDAIQFVGTPLALVAFVVAVVAYAYRGRLVERRKLIEAAPEAERGKLLDATIRDFTTVDTSTLTREQRYQLALRLIQERASRTRVMAMVGVAVAVILAVVIVVLPTSAADAVGLVVRVSEPGGGFVTTGELTLDAGAGRDTRPVGEDGQVRFDNVPRSALERGVSLIPRVPGYAPTPVTLTGIPADGVHYLQLDPVETPLFGTVVDLEGLPQPGVILDFENGLAVDTTDANGSFRVSLPHPPGSRVSVRGMREGTVGFNDMVTIPASSGLTLRFEAER